MKRGTLVLVCLSIVGSLLLWGKSTTVPVATSGTRRIIFASSFGSIRPLDTSLEAPRSKPRHLRKKMPLRVLLRKVEATVERAQRIISQVNWQAIAQCESGKKWSDNVGKFDGGLQFLPSTWDSLHMGYT